MIGHWRHTLIVVAVIIGVVGIGAAATRPLSSRDDGDDRSARVAATDSSERGENSASPTSDPARSPQAEPEESSDTDADRSTTTSAPPTTIDPAPAQPTPTASMTDRGSTLVPPATTTSSVPCRNSHDPACGPLQWDPDHGENSPLDVQIAVDPVIVAVGDEVVFTVRVLDEDAPIRGPECQPVGVSYGDAAGESACGPGCVTMFGRWDTPARQRGERTFTFRHTYAAAGTYEVYVSAESGNGCGNPYASEADGRAVVEVQ